MTNCDVLNSDAAWIAPNHTAGLGWTIKTQEGSSDFTLPARFVGFALIAEGLALREGMTSCRDMGLRKVRCESDSAQLIKAINSGTFHPELYGIISDICSLSCSFDEISFSWISREKNKAADKLAKLCQVGEDAIMADKPNRLYKETKSHIGMIWFT
uniref:RNase H type-1 domain-containing protein n=1 Tax=Brassica oleracea var. oleracea TaxID=109376 RepID=A0A0D3D084_BRAOL